MLVKLGRAFAHVGFVVEVKLLCPDALPDDNNHMKEQGGSIVACERTWWVKADTIEHNF